jgi:nicotinamidase-related amidase
MSQQASPVVDRTAMIENMKAALRIDPASAAVVTIDCQRGNLDPSIASLPVPEAEATRIVAGLNRLIGMARADSIPVFHVDTVYEPSLLGTHPFERAMKEAKQSFTPHKQSDFARHKSPGSLEAELVPDLDVRKEDYRVGSKRTFDSFFGTQLEILLRSMNIDTLLIGGCNTNTCVLATVFGAYVRGFKVIVLSDCVASAYGEDLHQFALSNIQRRLGWVLTIDELEAKLAPPRKRVAQGGR